MKGKKKGSWIKLEHDCPLPLMARRMAEGSTWKCDKCGATYEVKSFSSFLGISYDFRWKRWAE